MTESQRVTECRRKRKLDLMYIHGNKCAICGYNKTPRALQFHHINPEQKSFGISNGNTRNWEASVKESRKCILVCSNCHAEIHDGLINKKLETSLNEELLREINEVKGYEVDNNSFIKKDKKYYCQDCGKEITKGALYCMECRGKHSRVSERPDRNELKHLIRTLPFTKIGEIFNVSDNAIRKWCDAYNLPRKKQDIKAYSDEEWDLI